MHAHAYLLSTTNSFSWQHFERDDCLSRSCITLLSVEACCRSWVRKMLPLWRNMSVSTIATVFQSWRLISGSIIWTTNVPTATRSALSWSQPAPDAHPGWCPGTGFDTLGWAEFARLKEQLKHCAEYGLYEVGFDFGNMFQLCSWSTGVMLIRCIVEKLTAQHDTQSFASHNASIVNCTDA